MINATIPPINATWTAQIRLIMTHSLTLRKPLPRSCDTFVVMPKNKDHPIIFGKNSDRPDDEGISTIFKIDYSHHPQNSKNS